MYILRNSEGILIAKITNKAAKSLIMESRGIFQEKTFKASKREFKTRVYILEEDMVYYPDRVPYSDFYTKLFLWKGYYLHEED